MWDEGELWLLDTANESFFCIKIWHKFMHEIKEFYHESYHLKIKSNTGFQGEVIQNNFPTIVTDFSEHKEYYRSKIAAKMGFKSALGLPITYQGHILGVLNYLLKK